MIKFLLILNFAGVLSYLIFYATVLRFNTKRYQDSGWIHPNDTTVYIGNKDSWIRVQTFYYGSLKKSEVEK